MQFDVITMFPDMFSSYLKYGVIGKANTDGKITINFYDLRDFTARPAERPDGKPFGGGPGMILKIEPIYNALKSIKKKKKYKVILLSPSGKQFEQKMVQDSIDEVDQIIFICGRYEGVDARVKNLIDEELSIGPYVLAGGELGAMVMIEAISRHLPSVIGHPQALDDETFSHGKEYLEYPQYSRPEVFSPNKKEKWEVPKVLLSGDHAKIEEWKKENS